MFLILFSTFTNFLLPHKISFFSTNVTKQALAFPLLDTMVSNSQCPKVFLLFISFGLVVILFPIKNLPRVSFFLRFPLCRKFLNEIPFNLPI